MHVQNCCFANLNLLLFFPPLASVDVVVAWLFWHSNVTQASCLVNTKGFRFFKSKKAFVKTKKFHLVNENTVQPQCTTTSLSDYLPQATTCPKHQNFPSQSLTVGTSRKRPHPVSDHYYHFSRLTVYQFSIVFNLLWATTWRMVWSPVIFAVWQNVLCYLKYKKNLSNHRYCTYLHICNKLSPIK